MLGGILIGSPNTLLGLLGIIPPVLVAFGVVDLAGALWTHASLRGNTALAGAT